VRDELDEQLCNRYPLIFAQRFGELTETVMCWGFECDDGWYEILDSLCYSIQSYIDSNPHHEVPQVIATQVKEKFGTLRFYVTGGNDYTDGMIRMAEVLSERTCEQCGEPGKIRGSNWFYVACDKHTRTEHLINTTETIDNY
jgi:hypothetical protein